MSRGSFTWIVYDVVVTNPNNIGDEAERLARKYLGRNDLDGLTVEWGPLTGRDYLIDPSTSLPEAQSWEATVEVKTSAPDRGPRRRPRDH